MKILHHCQGLQAFRNAPFVERMLPEAAIDVTDGKVLKVVEDTDLCQGPKTLDLEYPYEMQTERTRK